MEGEWNTSRSLSKLKWAEQSLRQPRTRTCKRADTNTHSITDYNNNTIASSSKLKGVYNSQVIAKRILVPFSSRCFQRYIQGPPRGGGTASPLTALAPAIGHHPPEQVPVSANCPYYMPLGRPTRMLSRRKVRSSSPLCPKLCPENSFYTCLFFCFHELVVTFSHLGLSLVSNESWENFMTWGCSKVSFNTQNWGGYIVAKSRRRQQKLTLLVGASILSVKESILAWSREGSFSFLQVSAWLATAFGCHDWSEFLEGKDMQN